MNTPMNTKAKPAKKLTLSKETIGHLTPGEATNREPGFTLNCTYTC